MLCSISPSRKSNSDWLQRLRSSKGFPSGPDLDLEQFLDQRHESRFSSTAEVTPQLPDLKTKRLPDAPAPHGNMQAQNPNGDKKFLSVMNNVLAELFVMGDTDHLPKIQGKKCPRKQPNPSFCIPSSSLNCKHSNNNSNYTSSETDPRKDESPSPLSDDCSGVGMVKYNNGDCLVKVVANEDCGEEEEKEKDFGNLSGFSRTEVTVIDTSFAPWKFEKTLFRKKNVWKVRNKKGKMVKSERKKRKFSMAENEDAHAGLEKKQKILNGQCLLSKNGSGQGLDREYDDGEKSDRACKMTSDAASNAFKKQQATVLHGNLGKGSSSVVLIKSIPASKKIGTSIYRSCVKSSGKKQTKI